VAAMALLAAPGFAAGAAPTALGKLAASMKPGEWAALAVDGLDGGKTWAVANGPLFAYADKAVWDSSRSKLWFLGAAHGGTPNNAAFICYDAASNTVTRLPLPEDWKKFAVTHAYDSLDINPGTGELYYHRFGFHWLTVYDTIKGVWRQELVEHPVFGNLNNLTPGIAWLPATNRLAIYQSVTADLWMYDPSTTGVCERVKADLQANTGNYHQFTIYSPARKLMLFGGGNANGPGRNFFKLDAAGVVTACKPCPVGLGVTQTLTVADPVSGNLLVFDKQNVLREYNVDKDAWQRRDAGPWPFAVGHAVVAATIPEHGVILFLVDQKQKGFHLYKPGSPIVPEPATIQP
jgi:hypothetical protein